jgi:hypothetical protein
LFAENSITGKVAAGNLTLPNGAYRLSGLMPGEYRLIAQSLNGLIAPSDLASSSGSFVGFAGTTPPFRSIDSSASAGNHKLSIDTDTGVSQSISVSTMVTPSLRPQVIGLNAELSTVPLPLEAGKTFKVYVGGEGIDQLPAGGISVDSPFMKVNPASLESQQFGTSYPVVSFDLTVAPNAQAGDYSLRLQSTNGEVAYVAGGLTIDPGVNSSAYTNALDDPKFFVRQHYLDFMGREPDAAGLNYWSSQLAQCGTDAACLSARRVSVSRAFFAASEFQNTGSFVYRLYQSALGRRPSYGEFTVDRGQLTGSANLDANRQSLAMSFVSRPEFLRHYPRSMTAAQFADALLASSERVSGINLSSRRDSLIATYDGGDSGRAAILRQIADDPAFAQTQYNAAFVLMQYFGYLCRDVDEGGFDFWLNVLNRSRQNDPSSYRAMVCGFLTATEFQLRFGVVATHANGECGD